MDICSKCEKVILSDYKFCPRCGHSIYGESAPASEVVVTPDKPAVTEGLQTAGKTDDRAIRFFNVAQDLSSAANIDQLLQKIGTAVEEILHAERSSIMLLDETGKNLYFKTASGEDILKKLLIPVGQGLAGWIAENKKPDIVNDPYSDERFSPETDKKTGFKTKSIIGVPMLMGDELIGVVEAINKIDGHFNQDDMETLLGFAGLAAVSIIDTTLKTDQKNFFSNMMDFMVMASESLNSAELTDKGHAWEMARYAPQIGKELGLPEEKLQQLNHAALIHDLGFLGLENMELVGIQLDTELNDEQKFRLHPVIGGEMIKGIKIMQHLVPFVSYHHRYKNGTGFPENIPPEDITPEIEIISILERFFILKEKEKLEADKFSPEVFQAFCNIVP